MKHLIFKILRFFDFNRQAELHYRVFGSYSNLPRYLEVLVSFDNCIGRGQSIFRAIKNAFKDRWVIHK